jgi:extradiol dioxygenase family protein
MTKEISMKDLIHFYRVNDLSTIKSFYEDLLHLSLYKDQGKCLIYDTHGFGKIGFCTHFPAQELNQSCITFVYETRHEVDLMFTLLSKNQFKPEQPSYNKEFKVYHFFTRDPNHLQLEFQAFID